MANEMRLIDANALRKAIDLCDIDTFTDKQTICEQIAEAPTVDAKPVVHGRWDYMETEYGYRFICSCCSIPWMISARTRMCEKTNYCPHCGADMMERS